MSRLYTSVLLADRSDISCALQALGLPLSPPEPDFNGKLRAAIDETIIDLLGKSVLAALQDHLLKHYAVTPDEIPYRLDTMFESLERVFGVTGARTIGWTIARKLYLKIGLPFVEHENYRLEDYIEDAKKMLSR